MNFFGRSKPKPATSSIVVLQMVDPIPFHAYRKTSIVYREGEPFITFDDDPTLFRIKNAMLLEPGAEAYFDVIAQN